MVLTFLVGDKLDLDSTQCHGKCATLELIQLQLVLLGHVWEGYLWIELRGWGDS